ncbi:hypothetical protein SLEP1_g12141 [Rubroshorea leprosula]|nr:hypothetical protein SLEP1_g12141 [Rubroshorea leprosula]
MRGCAGELQKHIHGSEMVEKVGEERHMCNSNDGAAGHTHQKKAKEGMRSTERHRDG